MFLFYFIVSATTRTEKTASMATTNNNCIQLDDARTQNSQNKFVVCYEQTLQITQSYLVLTCLLNIIMFSSIRGFTVHLTTTAENKFGSQSVKHLD